MELVYGFRKEKLPKGLSYPLKRSVLDEALTRAAISNLHTVSFTRAQHQDPWSITPTSRLFLIRAWYCGDRKFAAAGLSSITVYAVPLTDRAIISETDRAIISDKIIADVLPQLIQWLQDLASAPLDSSLRAVDRQFDATWTAGAVTLSTW